MTIAAEAQPHRGISQEKLPLYLGFFEFVHNARRHGQALLAALLAVLVLLESPEERSGGESVIRRLGIGQVLVKTRIQKSLQTHSAERDDRRHV